MLPLTSSMNCILYRIPLGSTGSLQRLVTYGDSSSQRVLCTTVRAFRTRLRALTSDALRSAYRDEPLTSSVRAPPSAVSLSYIKGKILQTHPMETQEETIWTAPTIQEAWRALHRAYMAAQETDLLRAASILEKDMVFLALCTSHAEIMHLLALLPADLRRAITEHSAFESVEVEEFFIHVGMDIEVRGGDWVVQLPPPTVEELHHILRNMGRFGEDGRGCIASTAHRVSVWRGRRQESLGVTVRVGRFVPNAARALLPLAQKGSVLILSRAGVGKTTLLRDVASALARISAKPRVTVVDTSNEIGGDSPIPMQFLGRCRRIQVPRREEQSRLMSEVIQNHSPEYLIVDELATKQEAEAAWSIAQRGVHLVATCHGESLAGLLHNQSLNLLVGGTAHAFLSNEERRLRNKSKKTVLERPHASPFRFVVELRERGYGHIYADVNKAVDLILDGHSAKEYASVGCEAAIDAPLPAQLCRIMANQERAQSQRDGEQQHDDSSECRSYRSVARESVDSDGYSVRTDDIRRKKPTKKSSDSLLAELEDFL